MDIRKINDIIRNPEDIEAFTNADLKEIIRRYPYFQHAYALLAKKEVSDAGIENIKEVFSASILSSNRSELYEFIHPAIEDQKKAATTILENREGSESTDSALKAGVATAAASAGIATTVIGAEEKADTIKEEAENSDLDSDLKSSLDTESQEGEESTIDNTDTTEPIETVESSESAELYEEEDNLEKYSLDSETEVIDDEELELAGDILTEKSEEELSQELDELVIDEAHEYSGDLPISESLESEVLDSQETTDDEIIEGDSTESTPIETPEESDGATSAAAIGTVAGAAGLASVAAIESKDNQDLQELTEEVEEERNEEEKVDSVVRSKNRKKFDEKILPRLGILEGDQKDDFTLINAITKEIESTLNSLGIYTFDQLRKLYTEDIPILSLVTDIDAEKIQKERWFEQAFKIWSGEAMQIVLDRVGRADPRVKDDLTKIKGIGKVLAEKLYAVQLTTYDQISRFDSEDIEIVNDVIEFFPGRIERDEWVIQAKGFLTKESESSSDAAITAPIISLSNDSSEGSAAITENESLANLKEKLARHKALKSNLKEEAEKAEVADSVEKESEVEESPLEEEVIDLSSDTEENISLENETEEEIEAIDLNSSSLDEERKSETDEETEEVIEQKESVTAPEADDSQEVAAEETEDEASANSFTGWLEKLEQENKEKKKTELNEPILVKVDEDNVKEIHQFLGTDPDEIEKEEIPSFQIISRKK